MLDACPTVQQVDPEAQREKLDSLAAGIEAESKELENQRQQLSQERQSVEEELSQLRAEHQELAQLRAALDAEFEELHALRAELDAEVSRFCVELAGDRSEAGLPYMSFLDGLVMGWAQLEQVLKFLCSVSQVYLP